MKEIQPDGLETIRTYGEPGYLTEERDSEGGCIRYVYDNHHNLEEKSVLAAGALSWGGDVTAEEDMGRVTEIRLDWQETTSNRRMVMILRLLFEI